MFSGWSTALWALVTLCGASPLASPPNTLSNTRTLTHIVHQFDNGTWVENIASRANGKLLVTLLDRPELYEIDPRNPNATRLVHNFSGYTSLFGVSETSQDVFAVAAGNFSSAEGPVAGSFAIWRVALDRQGEVEVLKVTDIPDAVFLNGMTSLPAPSVDILVGDSTHGVVYRVDIATGQYSVALRDETFLPPHNASLPIGINGIRIHDQHLYYSNTFRQLFGRIPLNTSTGAALGPYEVIGTDFKIDDFAIDERNSTYAAAGFVNEVFKITQRGKTRLVVGKTDSSSVLGATSAALGRTWLDKDVLYITTSGGQASVLDGVSIEGGKVVALFLN
ncbi:hypothetical protein LMH87_001321 [Akanthomyces muscarius]|uniref:Uncharacterized protein n=1 Tax=Akanthomyces muscarius TaxID=2231603 RepID=A0A9W8ULY3_AKAMU|nr:hypothetical protein LMH87_001321 [Akanthomyces muscarius]KAJ4156108.1 hypothetical protein LMH87_001321 [Akanthomyces muscarius]